MQNLQSLPDGEAAIAYIHSKSIMHRDIKAQDFIPNGATTSRGRGSKASFTIVGIFWGGKSSKKSFRTPKKGPTSYFHRSSSMFRCSIPDHAAGYDATHFFPSQAENFLLSDKSPTSVATGFSKSVVL